MMKKYILPILTSIMILGACSDDDAFSPDYEVSLPIDKTLSAVVDASKTYQTMDGFGSSDAWTMNYIGNYWGSSTVDGMSKLLFSQNVTPEGQAEGIGLSIWRFNLGGGSAEQGAASGIEDKVRRGECFLNADGSYNWNKSAGQQLFLEKAKSYGCNQIVLFTGTPPVYYTKNGKAYSNGGASTNLKSDHYAKFADFLGTVALHFQNQGYNISYISPINEPQYNWTEGQEGCPWLNSETKKLAIELDKTIAEKGLNGTKMLLAEAAAWNYMYENAEVSGRANVIQDFFDPSSANYIGDLKSMPKMLCGHSYWTDLHWDNAASVRQKVSDQAKKYGVDMHQTEWSMMQEGYDECPLYEDASYMDIALAMARIIYQDIAVTNVRAWSYWSTVSQEQYSQKSRFHMIRIIPEGGDYGDLVNPGTYNANKNLWVLGNYSLFVRPGYKRIDLKIEEESKKFFGVAFISPESDKLVVVYINTSNDRIEINNAIQVVGKEVASFDQYTTSISKDLKKESKRDKGVAQPRSVSTFVYELK